MIRPNRRSVAAALLAGGGHVGALLALFETLEYTTVEATPLLGLFALLAFVQGAVPVLVSAHTRLLAPASGLVALFSGVVAVELSGAGDSALLEMYVMSIVTGLTGGFVVFAGVLEFAIRQGYRLGAGRLRNLPPLPGDDSSRRVAVGSAGLVGLPAGVLGFFFGGPVIALLVLVLVLATVAAAVPLLALLRGGFVSPLVPFAIVVPYVLYGHAFYMTEVSGMGLLLLGPAAVLSALAWKIERAVRSRIGGRDGTAFADRSDCG
ncbi:hypothetical protein JMJ58_08220 [Haloterrigena salifodinae]|uniref:Uncharacterized protein n=1 Tax=Haloterrigena salifodinae TaxID=2675099 RepID=A0A8T8E502_9EURY|nr:hypothetical protein [Haloterrigena salifodinae]QRV16838.1 hypothetical protein JMJ58_08220 [Haloterrigena salifodinae]